MATPGGKRKKLPGLIVSDPLLKPFQADITRREEKIRTMMDRLVPIGKTLSDVASGHEFFGLHFKEGQWIFREWAPNATEIFLVGDFNQWRENEAYRLKRIDDNGAWEIRLPENALRHEGVYRLKMKWPWGEGDRIPAYARRVVQDWQTGIFNAQIWRPANPFVWKHTDFLPEKTPLLIYETHVGMAQEEAKVGSYNEFRENILPRIKDAGYNTLQVMALPEHPYYGSFGYQISSFFAPSSRFGTPEELKELIDAAHGMGLAVVMDIIHSHAVSNDVEGLSCFDGTPYQYFHEGPRGIHPAWGSRCFNYSKPQVLHFLLSNCRYWLDEFHVDGFRFDGVTSMLYADHGLEKAFTTYQDYYTENTDEDALTYLALANSLIHELNPHAITIAEDVSGMPGLAMDQTSGGYGFDYRFAMGVPDYWIKLLKERRDEDWPMGYLWHELTNKRQDEKTISYCESHDQALVGDQTLIFRMMEDDMFWYMAKEHENHRVDRGMALHKIIRLITLGTAGDGYLNFMGNEFGHPEWIDFPRQGNNWSYHYARRQWSLADDPNLRYGLLGRFDKDMIAMAKAHALPSGPKPTILREDNVNRTLAFFRQGLVFVFNFHPTQSYTDCAIPAPAGTYKVLLDTDAREYGGYGRQDLSIRHFTQPGNPGENFLSLYLPSRTGMVFMKETK
ncbi:MAG: alpha amylase C-terminal domain-containing protein [Desulfatibacillum sp.]|nr:alpha amylase C-terminal domain-containing protein [Desulfatibacillum sp.]